MTETALRRARARAQLLHRPSRRPAVHDVVAHLLAVQAQDVAAAPLALRARARDLSLADVVAAREERAIVRTWGPRGTLHLIAVEDLEWLTALTRPATTATMRRLRQEGVVGSETHLVAATARALDGQGPLSKVELGERLAQLGAQGQAIVHLAALAAAAGLVVLGPDRSGKPTYVHTGDWLGRPLRLTIDRDRALAELAGRFLQAHAPAGPEDLAAWSGLGLTECRAAFAGRSPKRANDPRTPVPVRLLPAFDEFLLGWGDRSWQLDPAYTRQVQPGGGVIHPSVVADGRVIGTWRAGPTVRLFDEQADAPDLGAEQADLTRFLSDPGMPPRATTSRVRS